MKTKRSRIALWLFTCLALLVATLASRAQTTTSWWMILLPPESARPTPPITTTTPGRQSYSSGQISNVWWNWFGGAFRHQQQLGPMGSHHGRQQQSEFRFLENLRDTVNRYRETTSLWFGTREPPTTILDCNLIRILPITNFECDVRFAPGSASDAGDYRASPFSVICDSASEHAGYGQDWFGAVDIPATNTGWVHVSIPLNAIANPDLININIRSHWNRQPILLFELERSFNPLGG